MSLPGLGVQIWNSWSIKAIVIFETSEINGPTTRNRVPKCLKILCFNLTALQNIDNI
jgi:hypothetical protein